ncbi:Methylenetetrahydrofolate dehydrogenase (NADP+) / Methenyltetrahydrofolate cyclohydrolase [invertebrate metagenome]|uniref:Methylenetetrahydrofolate dehydrogenase (NADP+) / Methenyltetrahydrofolate cyclohydrolase n=1 Tax=invertebrate metagenome TaxID=1711999 RepID=A0A484H584_9ZZZZ
MERATIIDGKAYAARILRELANSVSELRDSHHIVPGLAIVLVGDDTASRVYVRNKHRQAQEIGMHSFVHILLASVTEKALLTLIKSLNDDPTVHGMLVQLPLPSHIDTQKVINTINPLKDVDCLHYCNIGTFFTSQTGIIPCTPLGCIRLLQQQHPTMDGMRALVIGRSNIVGKPMAHLLVQANCTVTIAHSKTRNLPHECRRADIVIAAAGQAEMIRGDWVSPGATVIDVGINRIHCPAEGYASRLVGDVCFAEVVNVAGAITPVPGGVGPMTVAMLLRNTLLACCLQICREVTFSV